MNLYRLLSRSTELRLSNVSGEPSRAAHICHLINGMTAEINDIPLAICIWLRCREVERKVFNLDIFMVGYVISYQFLYLIFIFLTKCKAYVFKRTNNR